FVQLDVYALAKYLDSRKPALLRLSGGIAEQLAHGRFRHTGEGIIILLQAVESVENAGLSQSLDQIDAGKPRGEGGWGIRGNDAQIRHVRRVVDLVADDVELGAAEREEIRFGKG